jgi:hypothetical protein
MVTTEGNGEGRSYFSSSFVHQHDDDGDDEQQLERGALLQRCLDLRQAIKVGA